MYRNLQTFLLVGTIIVLCAALRFAQAEEHSHDRAHTKSLTTIIVKGEVAESALDSTSSKSGLINDQIPGTQSHLSLGDALASEPGVSSSSFSPAASRPVIRGQGGQRVRILENGLSIGDVSATSDDHAVSYDTSSADKIDILRGPGTLFYGGSAIGGVVNITDGSIPRYRIGVPHEGEVELKAGNSTDELRHGRVMLQGESGEVNWHISGFYTDTDDIEIPGFAETESQREEHSHDEHYEEAEQGRESFLEDHHDDEDHLEHDHPEEEERRGTLDDSAFTSKGFKSGFSIISDERVTGFSLRYFDSKYGVPGHDHDSHQEDEHNHNDEEHEHDDDDHNLFHEEDFDEENHSHGEGVLIDIEQIRLSTLSHFDNPFKNIEQLEFSAALSHYTHTEFEGGETGTVFDSNLLNLRGELTHEPVGDLRGGGGIEILFDDFSAVGDEAFVPDSTAFTAAFFAAERLSLTDSFDLIAGSRYEVVDIDSSEVGLSRTFHALNLSAGSEKRFGEEKQFLVALTGSYSERAPTPTELFADGVHVATSTFETGDSSIGKERSFGAEARIAKERGRITGGFTAFYQNYSDYIFLAPQGFETEGVDAFKFVSDQARIAGFEAEARVGLLPQSWTHELDLRLQTDYVRGRLTGEDHSNLPRITPFRYMVGVEHGYRGLRTRVNAHFVERQDEVAQFETSTDGYIMLDASASYMLPTQTTQAELFVQFSNLLDEEARVHTSFLKDQAPLRGRAAYAGVKIAY